MKDILYKLFEHRSLARAEAKGVLANIARGAYNDAQLAAFMSVYLMRSITTEELSGFRDAILEKRVDINLRDYDAIDIVGTGGDGKNTFNISTAACFVLAGAGVKVVKHGNYGSSSVSGASNVLEEHGVKFSSEEGALRRSLEECNLAYLHAPLFSPALKSVGAVRKSLGVRTFFNMLGPLVNPVMPHKQMLGVYSLSLARLYKYVFEEQNLRYAIVTSLDGYDEISLTDAFKVMENESENVYEPEELGFERCEQGDLSGGGTPAQAAEIFDAVLEGRATRAQTNAVTVNAAFAIKTALDGISIEDAIARTKESICSGRAKDALNKFIKLNS